MALIKKRINIIMATTLIITSGSIPHLYAMGENNGQEPQYKHAQKEAHHNHTETCDTDTKKIPHEHTPEETSPIQIPATNNTVPHANERLFEILKHPWLRIDVNEARQILDDGADVNALYEPEGYTPLHLAALKHHAFDTGLAELLLSRKANVDAIDKQGATPLMLAARVGFPSFVKILLAGGANPNRATNSHYSYLRGRYHQKEEGQQTPLHAATHLWQTPWGADIIRMLIDAGADVHAVDVNGKTPLHIAARRSRPALGELFLNAHANTHTLDADKKSPLDMAISYTLDTTHRLRNMAKPLSQWDTRLTHHLTNDLNYHATFLKTLVAKEIDYYLNAVKEMLDPEEIVQTLLAAQCATASFVSDSCLAVLYKKIGQAAAQDTSILQSALADGVQNATHAAATHNATHASELISDPTYPEAFLQTLSTFYAVCADNPLPVAAALVVHGIYDPSLYRSAYQKITGFFRVSKNITTACYYSLCDSYGLQTQLNIVSNANTELRTRLALQEQNHERRINEILEAQTTHTDNNNEVDIVEIAMPQLLLPILQEKHLIALIKEYALEKEYTPTQRERALVWQKITHLWEQEKIQQKAHYERMAHASQD